MENFDNLLNIYNQLGNCSNPDEVEKLKNSLSGSIDIKKRRKESDPDLCRNGGSKELGIRNEKKCRMSSVAEKSREVNKLIKEVKELAEIGKFGDDLTIEDHEGIQVKFPTSNLVGENFEGYKSEISDLLTKNRVWTIGVWGMGGVGKTTLITHLHNMMLDQPDIYGSVYWVIVSKDCSIQKLQTNIAKKMGVDISNEFDELQSAGILAEMLKKKKKFILILDDVWSDFDLNKVGLGIPKEVGYQLIVTSQSKDVCLKMGCKNIIKVDPLSDEDAWTLFVNSIGREIPHDLTKISIDVLKECAGLPFGIIILAKSMIGCNDVQEWRNVLDELRNSSGKVEGMEEKVFNVLRLSYERLNDLEIKECLLYCAIYPEDARIEINELIWLFIDVGVLGKNIGMAKMVDKGFTILKKLERVALLSIIKDRYSGKDVCVCLHDLIRDMILQIAGSQFIIKAGIGLKNIPDEESWTGNIEVVSLMENQIEEIFDFSPKCNRLSILLLQDNRMHSIFDDFFMYLHGLKYLNLSNSEIKTLPKSITLLKSLTALILTNCEYLENVSSLAELSYLERLDLCGALVSELPDIGRLIKLRYLDLCLTRIYRIGVGVISKLTALQYLAITARFEVKEVNSLNKLEHLTAQFEDFVSFLMFIEQMKVKGLPNSYFFVLSNEEDIFEMSHDWSIRQISISNAWSGDIISHDVDLNKVPDLDSYNELLNVLFGYHNTSLESSFAKSRDNLQESLEIEGSTQLFCANELQMILQDITIIHIWKDQYVVSLEDFVFDTVCNLPWQSKIGRPQPFSNLKSIIIYRCPKLKKLLPFGLLSNFQNIEAIKVTFCDCLEELIEGESDETKSGGNGHLKILSLPKLKDISLQFLPNLKRLCSDDKVIRTPSLQVIEINQCLKLKRMTFDVDRQHPPFPQMFYAKWEKEWFDALEWNPLESKSMIDIKT